MVALSSHAVIPAFFFSTLAELSYLQFGPVAFFSSQLDK